MQTYNAASHGRLNMLYVQNVSHGTYFHACSRYYIYTISISGLYGCVLYAFVVTYTKRIHTVKNNEMYTFKIVICTYMGNDAREIEDFSR